ncbi:MULTISPECIES: putative quinol monooxygenase [Priestia]|uniref:putative quinol monooxygenase n=1 Tax=Priestia TaxID=2800373 RepID=UPI001ADF619C|nr:MULTISPECIES: putative quinol monooxygenase [Priestia]
MADIIINAILQAKPGKETFLREELVKVIAPSRAEDGCIQYTLHEDINKKNTFVFYERWKNEEALLSHLETSHYKHYRSQTEQLLESREVHRLKEIR